MSKRDVGSAVGWYKENGYLPEAVRNFLCLLGWNPKTDQELLTIEEVVALFDVTKVNRKAAVFDLAKCEWMNQQYLLKLAPEQLAAAVEPFLQAAGVSFGTREALLPVLALVRERLKRLTDAPSWVDYFFTEDYAYEPEAVTKVIEKPGSLDRLRALAAAYGALENWTAAELEAALKAEAAKAGVKAGEFVHPIRVATTGRTVGVSLYHTLELLGKARTLARCERTLAKFAA